MKQSLSFEIKRVYSGVKILAAYTDARMRIDWRYRIKDLCCGKERVITHRGLCERVRTKRTRCNACEHKASAQGFFGMATKKRIKETLVYERVNALTAEQGFYSTIRPRELVASSGRWPYIG